MFRNAHDKARMRNIIQACSESRRWAEQAQAKGFICDVRAATFTRPDCRIEFVNGQWRVAEVRVAGLREIGRADMLLAALEMVVTK